MVMTSLEIKLAQPGVFNAFLARFGVRAVEAIFAVDERVFGLRCGHHFADVRAYNVFDN